MAKHVHAEIIKALALHTKQQVEHPEDGLYFKGDSPAYLKGIDYVMIAD